MGLFSVWVVATVAVMISLSSSVSVTPSRGPPPLHALKLNLTRTNYGMYYTLVVAVSLGTPPVEQVLVMDTGSSLTWTQCQPCQRCFNQRLPYYNSTASRTFRKVPCGHPICDANLRMYTCVHNECVYKARYGDGTRSNGLAASDTFSFSAGGVVFGCSRNATPVTPSGHVSGIMGLSRAPESVLNQVFPPEKRRFSYCLSHFGSGKVASTTLMTFGDDVVPAKTPLRTTPLVDVHDGFHSYNLNLLDISVGNRRFKFPAGTFGPSEVIIDSGTTIPELPGKPYAAVIGEFERHYSALGLKRIKSPPEVGGLNLCYRRPAGFRDYMNLTYHFQGADYFVDSKYTSFVRKTSSFFCVAVQQGNLVVLGTWHQQNMRLVYDVPMGHLAFGPQNC